MRLFTADVGGSCESQREISDAGYMLVEYAARLVWGECPEVVRPKQGKPCFTGGKRFFSLSHTGSRLLVGVSDFELGVDAERRREVRPGLVERLTTAQERAEFDFFELWTLREAIFKLTGRDWLMSIELRRDCGRVVTPYKGVRCRSYELPGCAVAAASYAGDFPEKIENVSPELFFDLK